MTTNLTIEDVESLKYTTFIPQNIIQYPSFDISVPLVERPQIKYVFGLSIQQGNTYLFLKQDQDVVTLYNADYRGLLTKEKLIAIILSITGTDIS